MSEVLGGDDVVWMRRKWRESMVVVVQPGRISICIIITTSTRL